MRDYSKEIDACWATIERAWNDYGHLGTILELNLAKQQVLAYPGMDYVNDLTERTREETRRSYERTLRDGSMMLFVRDSANRVLQSHVFNKKVVSKRRRKKPAEPR